MSRIKVTIGVPSNDMVHADFAMSLAALCLASASSVDIKLFNGRSSIVATGRNLCVESAQAAASDFLFFLDSDMVFPADTMIRLLNHNKQIVGGTYMMRRPPYVPIGVPLRGQPASAEGLISMYNMPTGCFLIRMDVFRHFTEKPIFWHDRRSPDVGGEDVLFCESARQAGISVWCDPKLSQQLGHIGQRVHYLGVPDTADNIGEYLARFPEMQDIVSKKKSS